MIKLKREVKVGLFALITLFALYWGINFLKGRDLFNINNTYYAMYDQVNGIQKSSAIVIKGFKVGVISDITYNPAQSDKIVLHFSIKNKFKIPENSSARIYSDGLLGGKAVEIELGNSDKYLHDGDTLPSFMDKDLFDIAGSELEFLKQKLNTLTNDISKTLENVDMLITDNAVSIATTFTNIAEISESLKNVVSSEEGDLQDIVKNMNALSATLRDNSGKIDRIVSNVENITDSLNHANIPTLVGNLSHSLGEMNDVLVKINRQDGTLGKLVGDDALYDSLVSATSNLSSLLEDLKENPGEYVHFSLFGRKKK